MANIRLDPQRRGDPFDYSSTLTDGYVSSMIDEMWFTLRTAVPDSTVNDDADAIDQGKLTSSEITFSDATNFSVKIPGARTKAWPVDVVVWDCRVRVSGIDDFIIASGTLLISGDITRSR